jgi:hypothetical protein
MGYWSVGSLRLGDEVGFAFRLQRRSPANRSLLELAVNSTNPSADKPPSSDSQRIRIGRKAPGVRCPRPEAQGSSNISWTDGHHRPLVFVRLRATRGYREKCVALPEGGDDTCCSASSPLPRRASPATAGCEALGTTYPHPRGWRSQREPRSRLPAPRRSGTRGAW